MSCRALSPRRTTQGFWQGPPPYNGGQSLKFAMPLLSLGIIGLYLLPDGATSISLDLPVSIDSLNLSSKGLKMINPRYAGGNDKIGRYKIEAEYALQQISATHVLELHKISGTIEQTDNKWTKLKATKGIYDTKTERMELDGDIVITSKSRDGGKNAKRQN